MLTFKKKWFFSIQITSKLRSIITMRGGGNKFKTTIIFYSKLRLKIVLIKFFWSLNIEELLKNNPGWHYDYA